MTTDFLPEDRIAAPAPKKKFRLGTTELVYIALIVLVVGAAILYAARGQNFFSTSSLSDWLTRSSVLGFVALGQTLVILGRSLDLSVGYVAALSSLVAGGVMAGESGNIVFGVLAGLGVGAFIGVLNGVVITMLKVNPFIATVGMGLILKGYIDVSYNATNGKSPANFTQVFGFDRIGPVPVSTIVMVLAVGVLAVVLLRTKFGAHLFAVGGSDGVARLSGLRTTRTLIVAHVLCGALAGMAGLLLLARQGTGSVANYTLGYDLNSVAAVVLGGTLLMGGRGSIAGTFGGVLIIALLDSAFNVLGVNSFLKDVLRGVIIILAVALYARRQIDSHRPRFDSKGRRRASDVADHEVPSKPLAPTTGPGADR